MAIINSQLLLYILKLRSVDILVSGNLRGSKKICVNSRNQHLFLMEDFYADYTGDFRPDFERLSEAGRFIKRKRLIAAIN